MDTLEQLAVALGLAGLAGINLYLTVFATGLAIRCEWIHLAAANQGLEILGSTPVLVLAGVLYFLEFFADKIPWVDSLNDGVHTFIRPVGAAFLGIQVLGTPSPVFDVLIGLLTGSVALATHTAKAGTRLVANASPEPFTNIALSTVEDAAVLGGLFLVNQNPYLAAAIMVLVVGLIIYIAPKLLRLIRTRLWLIWRKFSAPASSAGGAQLGSKLPPDGDAIFTRLNPMHETVEWCVPCIGANGKKIPSNVAGWLVATAEQKDVLHFVSSKETITTLELAGFRVGRESHFLSEDLVVYRPDAGRKARHIFLFDRSRRDLCDLVVAAIEERIPKPDPAIAEPATV